MFGNQLWTVALSISLFRNIWLIWYAAMYNKNKAFSLVYLFLCRCCWRQKKETLTCLIHLNITKLHIFSIVCLIKHRWEQDYTYCMSWIFQNSKENLQRNMFTNTNFFWAKNIDTIWTKTATHFRIIYDRNISY